MTYKSRTHCVICSSELVSSYIHKRQPTTYCPKITDWTTDSIIDLEYGTCTKCSSVQLMTLVDPSLLYEDAHNNTQNTPTWAAHHKEFAEFISEHKHMVEVGGGSGALASILLEKNPGLDYSMLDICPPSTMRDNITYITGNCETYTFTGQPVIMSHLFEHLYDPCAFIANLAKCGVHDVYISVPNMKKLLDERSIAVIHIEHTYYADDKDIEYMFAKYGYKLEQKQNFRDHSIFFHFMLKPTTVEYMGSDSTSRGEKILEIFRERDARLAAIQLQPNSFIVPAGIYGQMIYTHTRHNHGDILGFLDNDSAKQGKRVYGTPVYTYPMAHLMNYSDTVLHIYLYAGPYTAEIERQLREFNSNIVLHAI